MNTKTPNAGSNAPPTLAAALNRDCACVHIDHRVLEDSLSNEHDGIPRALLAARPHLFSDAAVFLSHDQAARMQTIIRAIEEVVAMPAYREAAMQHAPAIARHDAGPLGVFLGYDFHLGADGPQLIEINTNAGGALLNSRLAQAQRACCETFTRIAVEWSGGAELEQRFFEMFMSEWQRQQRDQPLVRVAIVDDAPTEQYLYPEFLLFVQLFRRHGVDAAIADAAALERRGDGLYHAGQRIDLVYNRLTDFALAEPRHAHLRAAYLDGQIVVTPPPRAHALYADKRNLALLTDPEQLRALGAPETTIAVLSGGIPRTVRVTRAQAARLWTERRHLFFKPAAGYGGKAAYRGDKITRRAFEEVLAGDYVAQNLVTPSERLVRFADEHQRLKLDLRCYVYDGTVQLRAARLYQGQTTNFRTPGGGFAPVAVVADVSSVIPPTAFSEERSHHVREDL